jgi:hypothetical protein
MGVDNMIYAETLEPTWPMMLQGWYTVGGAVTMAAVYIRWPWPSDNLSARTCAVMYVYLFMVGSQDLIYQAIVHELSLEAVPLPKWFFGPLHIVPGIFIAFFRKSIQRQLGEYWLDRHSLSIQREAWVDGAAAAGQGTLSHVENALSSDQGLNTFQLDDAGEVQEYALLHYASINGEVGAVIQLLSASDECGLNINLPSRTLQQTPLFLAAKYGHIDIVTRLIQNGADTNTADAHGTSPLYVAVFGGHTASARALINGGAYGADFNQEIILVAERKGHHDIVQLLLEECNASKTNTWMGLSADLPTRATESQQTYLPV